MRRPPLGAAARRHVPNRTAVADPQCRWRNPEERHVVEARRVLRPQSDECLPGPILVPDSPPRRFEPLAGCIELGALDEGHRLVSPSEELRTVLYGMSAYALD